jgi:acetate kinase
MSLTEPVADTATGAGSCPAGGSSQRILTINGGSSSIKFAIYSAADPPRCLLSGLVDRIGLPNSTLRASDPDGRPIDQRTIDAADHRQGAECLIQWLRQHLDGATIAGVGHRVVHGGVHLVEHQLVTKHLIAELRRTQPLDLAHLPREIALIEAFHNRFPRVPQVACFDTAFHRDLPTVAQLLPIPHHFHEEGVRRFGFHGLSYTYLMAELGRVAGAQAAAGRVILAHLGSGASMAAVHRHKPVDTTMGFTPTAGLVMATRPGDLDPGLLVYMMRVLKMSPEQADEFISHKCGLLGISGTTSDVHDLLERRATDPRAAEAIALFCYQIKKWIGAYAAALAGLDTLVFAGGIGEHASQVRAEICEGLAFLGIYINPDRNAANAPVISVDGAPVTVRVMHTDEERVIAEAVCGVLEALSPQNPTS